MMAHIVDVQKQQAKREKLEISRWIVMNDPESFLKGEPYSRIDYLCGLTLKQLKSMKEKLLKGEKINA